MIKYNWLTINFRFVQSDSHKLEGFSSHLLLLWNLRKYIPRMLCDWQCSTVCKKNDKQPSQFVCYYPVFFIWIVIGAAVGFMDTPTRPMCSFLPTCGLSASFISIITTHTWTPFLIDAEGSYVQTSLHTKTSFFVDTLGGGWATDTSETKTLCFHPSLVKWWHEKAPW